MTDRNCLSYWFPKIEAAGLPVPKTRIVAMPDAAQAVWWKGQDGEDPTAEEAEAWNGFLQMLQLAAEDIGYPAFLRTGHTSHKHAWRNTCFLAHPNALADHVSELIEFSECAGIIGLPYRNWAVREILPTLPLGTCQRYGGMPICREFRFFVDDGEVRCAHPYWPLESLREGDGDISPADYEAMCRMGTDESNLRALASSAGRAVGGSWSVDILETQRGWFITDLAEASESFHWEGCPKADSPPHV